MSRLGIFNSIDDPAFIAYGEGRLIESNLAFTAMLGPVTARQLITDLWPEMNDVLRSALAASSMGKQLRVDVAAKSADGRDLVFDVRLSALDDRESDDNSLVVVARDVTADRTRSNLLEIQATIDPLTGAFNRGQKEVLLDQAIRSARRRKVTGCFIFIDIDDFKTINDSHGHDEGDRILKRIVRVLHENLRNSDVVGRFGGDEFAAILTDSDPDSGPVKAQQIARILNLIPTNTSDIGINVSIGLTVFPIENDRVEDVVKRTDTAMYRAKEAHSGKVEVWENG
jgi:diguanylate cyclase (GGDEF)-like protein